MTPELVVCVNNRPIDGANNDPDALCQIMEGQIYTVRSRVPQHRGVRLEEIKLPLNIRYMAEGTYFDRRFRPCRPTNIDEFKKMLNPTPEQVRKFQLEDA